MKYLITGASGLIGKKLVNKLLEDYLDMIIRSDIFSSKRKNFNKLYKEKKPKENNENEIQEEEENKIYMDFLMSIYGNENDSDNEEEYFI